MYLPQKRGLTIVFLLALVTAYFCVNTTALASPNKRTVNRIRFPCSTCLRLIRDPQGRQNSLGNPIYILEVYATGRKLYALDAVTGRAYTQNRDRNVAGTQAPLPDGNYSISSKIVPGTIFETGGTFINIYPRFPTGRSDLGIHYDPSFDQANGEDGTSGCIALTNKADRDLVNNFVRSYHPQTLIVNIK